MKMYWKKELNGIEIESGTKTRLRFIFSTNHINLIQRDFRRISFTYICIGSLVTNWIESWLSDRKQRVVINDKCSGWSEVSSRVPQGSVLGTIVFVIFINDIEDGICGNILKFADDTKLFCKIGSDINCAKLRADLRKLYNWSQDWQMLFNLDKCKIMHFGYNNPNNILLLGHILETVDEEKDLGVMIWKDLKASSQCVKIVKTANHILGMIKRTFIFKIKDNLLQLYKCLVRPHS